MKKWNKGLWAGLAILIAATAYAAGTPHRITTADSILFGRKASSDPKALQFQTATTPKNFTLDPLTGFWSMDGNQLSLGDGLGTDKTFRIANGAGTPPFFRYEAANSRFVFSNDGVNARALGSGSGGAGGENLLAEFNADMEAGISNWTGTPAATSDSATPLFGLRSLLWNPTAGAQTLQSALRPAPAGITSGTDGNIDCLAQFYYQWPSGVAGDLIAEVLDGSSNVIATTGLTGGAFDVLVPTTSTVLREIGPFSCTAGTSYRLQVRSTADAAEIELDNAHLGEDTRDFEVAQAEAIFQGFFAQTASCNWSRNNVAQGDLTATAACPAITVSHATRTVNSADTDLPQVVFSQALEPGVYKVEATLEVSHTTGTESIGYRLSDGTTNSSETISRRSTTADHDELTLTHLFVYTAPTTPTFKIQCKASAGNCEIINDLTGGALKFTVTKYPLGAMGGRTYDTAGWFVDVNIAGANALLGTGDITTYDEITNGSLTLTPRTGSAPVEIPCLSGTASTGATCSGVDESIGVVFTPPEAGIYEACAEFAHLTQTGSPGSANITFQIIETPNASDAITQEGGSRIASQGWNSGTASIVGTNPMSVCGLLNFTSVQERTIRLMREQDITTTVTNNEIVADASATLGQRDIRITVRPWTAAKAHPVVNNAVTIPGVGAKWWDCRFTVNFNSGTPTEVLDYGGCLSTTPDTGIGRSAITFTAGFFSQAPHCVISSIDGGTRKLCQATTAPTTTGIADILCAASDTGTATDSCVCSVSCGGPH